MRVIVRNFSTFYDIATKTQFSPVLDQKTGCYVGVAELSEEAAKPFEGRRGFEVIEDEDFLTMISKPVKPAPAQPSTGDPLTGCEAKSVKAAKDGKLPADPGPPPPPPSS